MEHSRLLDVRGFLGDVEHALYCTCAHESTEVYLWCRRCWCQVGTPDHEHCDTCGLEVALHAPDQFYERDRMN